MKVCPYCGKTGSKFSIRKAKAGHWIWGCWSTSCQANFDNLKAIKMADMIGFIAMQESCDRSGAIDKLLELAGVSNPREEFENRTDGNSGNTSKSNN
jgi:hypothetical protein